MKKMILAAFLGTVFLPASVLAQTAQNVIFRADFNTGNSPYQFEGQYPMGTNWSVETVNGGGKDGSSAAHLVMNQGRQQFQSGWYWNGTKPNGGWTWNDVAYVRFRIKFDDNYRWDGSGSQQNKMVDIGGGSNSRVILHNERSRPTTPCSINYVDYNQQGNPMYYTPSYFGLPDGAFDTGEYGFFSMKNGIDFPCTPPVLTTHGVWYDVQMAVKLSSASGVQDGYFKLWVNNNDGNSPSSQALNIARNLDEWNTSWDFGGYWTNLNSLRSQGWTVDDFEVATTFDPNWHTAGSTPTPTPTPSPDATAPTTPTGLTSSSVTQTGATLLWSASTDPAISGATTSGVAGYRVYRGGVQVASLTSTSYSDTGLTAGTSYSYTVRAIDVAGNLSASSATLTVTTAAPTPTPTPTAGVFFNEGFEAGVPQSFMSQYYGNLQGHTQFSIQSVIRAAGQYAVRYQYLQGVMNNDYITQHFGDSTKSPVLSSTTGNTYPDVYVQYKTYYAPGFSWAGQNNKQLILGTDDGVSHSVCCNPWVAHYATILSGNDGTRGWFDAEANNKNNAGSQWIDLSPNYNGYNVNTNPYYIVPGQWYTVEVRRRLNDSGVANGIFEMWVNGTQIARYTNIQYRLPGLTNFAYGNNFAMLTKYISNPAPQNQEVYYDDVKFSTGYIGADVAPTPTADTTSPTTPTTLSATTASTSQINLTWSASTDAVGVAQYQLERCTGATCTTFTQIATPTTTSYSDTTLTAGTTYRYRVRAVDAAGNRSAYSTIVSATTQSIITPTLTLSATPTALTAGNTTTLTWSSTNATSCSASNGWTGTKATSGSQTLTPTANTTYTLTCTGAGGTTTQSASVTVSAAVDTTSPLLISTTISNTTATSTRITVTANEYVLATLRYGLTSATLTNTATSNTIGTTHIFDLGNLTRRTTYFYQVTLTDAAGNTTTGPVSFFTTLSRLPKPPKVENLTATEGSVILTWTNPVYEYTSDIRIYRRTSNGNVLNNPDSAYYLATVPAGTTTYTDTAVQPGTTYHYTIFTHDDQGTYSDPTEIAFTTGTDTVVTTPAPAPAPTTPTTVVSTPAPSTGTTPSTPATTPPTQTPTTGTTTTPPVTTTPSTTYPPLTRALGLGSKGDDVKTLQSMLAQDKSIYPEGDITGYYGPATQRAVQRFQTKYAIVSSGSAATTGYGQVGPATRTQLNTLYAGTTASTGLTPEKRALIEAQIRLLQEQVRVLLQQLVKLLAAGA